MSSSSSPPAGAFGSNSNQQQQQQQRPTSSWASSLANICTVSNLTPIYGKERAERLVRYVIEDFAQEYGGNFTENNAMQAQVQRGQCMGLLLSMLQSQKDGTKVWIGIFFPPAFPDQPPQVALLLSRYQYIPAGHAVVAPNGAVNIVTAAASSDGQQPQPQPLISIFIELFELLNSDPVRERPRHEQQAQAGGSAGAAGVAGTAAPVLQPFPTAAGQEQSPEHKSLYDLFVNDYHMLTDRYLTVRREAKEHGSLLGATTESLRREEAALQSEVRQLQIAVHEQSAMQAIIDSMSANGNGTNNKVVASGDNGLLGISGFDGTGVDAGSPTSNDRYGLTVRAEGIDIGTIDGAAPISLEQASATDCVEPLDNLHGQALNLLATINAHHDQIQFLDDCLATKDISSDEYFRYLGATARKEFLARYMYGRVINKLQRQKNAKALLNRFRSKGLDEVNANDLLARNDFCPKKAEKELSKFFA